MYHAMGSKVIYVHDVDMAEELFLTVHRTKDCTKSTKEQAEVLARMLNDHDDQVKGAYRGEPQGGPEMTDYNDGFTHEALHTTFVLTETFHDHVFASPCAKQFPDVAAAADTVIKALADLYQMIGSKMPE